MSDEYISILEGKIEILTQRIAALESAVDQAPERQAVFGRNRHFLWGRLEDMLLTGGTADVTIRKYSDGWEDGNVLEDVTCSPLFPSACYLPVDTLVRVDWSQLCQRHYVTAGSICPKSQSDSSSSS